MQRIPQHISKLSTGRLIRFSNTPRAAGARLVHITAPAFGEPPKTNHTTDTYSKDVDETPVSDSTVYRIDPNSETVQKPHEPPSGEWSRAGVKSEEYRHTEGSKEPYAPQGGNKGRYGSRMGWADDKGPETAKPEEGPAGKSSQGRK